MKLADFDRALDDYNHALQIKEELPNTHMNRGLLLLLKGNDAEAEKDFERCLSLSPGLKSELEKRIALAKEIRAGRP
jgi:tetratricopeptide (TPR) repeat protein